MTSVNISMPEALRDQAKEFDIPISRTCRQAIEREIRLARARQELHQAVQALKAPDEPPTR